MCGEHAGTPRQTLPSQGSSPRVWGASNGPAQKWEHVRIIPTCVGSIVQRSERLCGGADHPHVCGEHLRRTGVTMQRQGSSPRVWGAYATLPPSQGTFGIIPTCVGSMTMPCVLPLMVRDHPHVCGEHLPALLPFALQCGSSPRVWGAYGMQRVHKIRSRIIPTCVGSI